MATIGFNALTGPRLQPLLALVAVLAALAIALPWRRRQQMLTAGPLVFDEQPDELLRLHYCPGRS